MFSRCFLIYNGVFDSKMRLKKESVGRFFKSASGSFFLFGPRGTGKSTWVRGAFPEAVRLDLLDPESVRMYSARPERLREVADATPEDIPIVIDEVQRVPDLLNVVHQLIERDPRRVFVLTGSSARKLRRSGVDLLAGRAVVRRLHPFMAAELGNRFDLGTALRDGLVPLVLASATPQDVLKTYAALYLREEVQTEGLVRNVGQFARFMEAISFSHGAVLNVSNVARECEVQRKTVEGFLGILHDLLLSFELPVFHRRAKRACIRHNKFYLFDTGVFRSLRPSGPLDRPEELEGAALEGLVAQHLRAWIDYRGRSNTLYFWRTRSGTEVDFVLYGDDGLWAFEVKNAARIHPSDTRALGSFREEYPEARTVLLHRGADRILQQGVLCLPCDAFLRGLHPTRGLDKAVDWPSA